jgi:hypothetical protein
MKQIRLKDKVVKINNCVYDCPLCHNQHRNFPYGYCRINPVLANEILKNKVVVE